MNRKRIFSAVVAFLLSVTLIFGTQVNSASAADGGSVPIGTITAYAGSLKTPQDIGKLQVQGWLVCRGQEEKRSDYPELFAIIGSLYGEGDKVNTFNLPDLRGRFVRGVDDGFGRDPDAKDRAASAPGGIIGDNVGSVQDDEFKSHRHQINKWSRSFKGSDDSEKPYNDQGPLSGETFPAGGSETRPKNIYLNYIIKAKNV